MDNQQISNQQQLKKLISDQTQKRLHILMLILSACFIIGCYVLASFLIPNFYSQIPAEFSCQYQNFNSYSFCSQLDIQSNNIWQSYLMNMNFSNSFFLIGANAIRSDSAQEEIRLSLNYTGQIIPLDYKGDFVYQNESISYIGQQKLEIICQKDYRYCEDNIYLLYPQIKYPNYLVRINFQLDQNYLGVISKFAFYGVTQNSQYTIYILFLRYILLAISITSLIFYLFMYCSQEKKDLSFEHKFILILSLSLVLFNDPFYSFTILYSSISLCIISTISVTQLIAFLLFFWGIEIKRMYKEIATVETKEVKLYKILVTLIFFGLLTTASSIAGIYSRLEPGLSSNFTYPWFYRFFWCFYFVLASLYLVYYIYHIYNLCKQYSLVLPRHKFLLIWSFYFIILLYILLATGIYQTYESNGIKILILFIMCNYYVIILQIFWRFNKGQILIITKKKVDVQRRSIEKRNTKKQKNEQYEEHQQGNQLTQQEFINDQQGEEYTRKWKEEQNKTETGKLDKYNLETNQINFQSTDSDCNKNFSEIENKYIVIINQEEALGNQEDWIEGCNNQQSKIQENKNNQLPFSESSNN